VDGNKRIRHAALEAMLMPNGLEVEASVDDAEARISRRPRTRNVEPLECEGTGRGEWA